MNNNNPFLNSLLKLSFVTAIIVVIVAVTSCGKKSSVQHSQNELARVNNYEITMEDFEIQKKKTSHLQPLNNTAQYKANMLNLLIDNALLLQEADRKKITQNKEFLKSIEHFWRQSLIHELLNIKMTEIKTHVIINENDVKAYYDLLKNKYFIRQIKCSAKLPVSFNDFQELEMFLANSTSYLINDTGWCWSDFREFDASLKNIFLHTPVQSNKLITLKDDNAVYFYVISNIEKNNIEAYDSLKPEIIEQLQKDEEQKQLKKWLQDLRKNAKIEINNDLLSKL